MEKNHAAYSDLVRLNSRDIGVLYETQNYSAIVFSKVEWDR
jgi:sialidase-1